jgi:hypothetical protein
VEVHVHDFLASDLNPKSIGSQSRIWRKFRILMERRGWRRGLIDFMPASLLRLRRFLKSIAPLSGN